MFNFKNSRKGSVHSIGLSYGWFHLATSKICWHWWKLQYGNRCHFLSWNKNFMKILVHLIWACKHSNFKFESKNQFCLHTLLISTKMFIKFLLLDKKWQRLQYCNFHQCQHIFAVARCNHPYMYFYDAEQNGWNCPDMFQG